MKKVACAKCGGAMKKMAKGGSMKTTVGSKSAKSFIAGIPNSGPTGPNYQGVDTMKKGGSIKKKMAKGGSTSFGMLSVKAGIDKNPKPTAADRIAGAKKKAKFGASVPVQHSPAPGRVRSSSGVGTVPVGARKKMGGTIRKKK
jgi:hypothetical protein